MPDDTALDTAITEPSLTAGEAEMLIFALDRSRATFAWKSGGLDAQALNKAHPPSTMTLAGIIKHLAWVDDWTGGYRRCPRRGDRSTGTPTRNIRGGRQQTIRRTSSTDCGVRLPRGAGQRSPK